MTGISPAISQHTRTQKTHPLKMVRCSPLTQVVLGGFGTISKPCQKKLNIEKELEDEASEIQDPTMAKAVVVAVI